jgi:hypothetical protein
MLLATFDQHVLVDHFVNRVLVPFMLRWSLKKILLILDSAPCHKTAKMNNALLSANIKKILIPASTTGILQMADVLWFAFMKK